MIVFATRLKKLRAKHGVTQDMLAKEIGSENTVISRYENNIINPGIDVLCAIADYFDVTTDYLLGRSQFSETDEYSKEHDKAIALLEFVKNLYGEELSDGR